MSGRAEGIARCGGRGCCGNIYAGGIKNRGRHLGGDKPPPRQVIEVELPAVEEWHNALRRARRIGGADGFVRFLRALRFGLETAGRCHGVGVAECCFDEGMGVCQRTLGKVERVRAHVGDETDGTCGAERDAFV